MEQFNPSLRNFIAMGKNYEKALAGKAGRGHVSQVNESGRRRLVPETKLGWLSPVPVTVGMASSLVLSCGCDESTGSGPASVLSL